MRNSALPFVAAMTVAILLVMRMASLPTAEPGSAGPELANGIFRLPKQTRLRLPSGAVSTTNAITCSAAESADGQASDRWRVVVVADEDHAPLTAALVLALSERLTEEGAVVLIDTLRERPLQLPADRVLCVSTRTATLPEAPGGGCSAELAVVDRLLAFPPGTLAAVAAAPIAQPLNVRFAITHSSHGAAGASMHWGGWYAAVGRSMADELLARMAPGLFAPAGAAVATGAAAATGAVTPAHRVLAERSPRADWQSPLPAPPFIEPVRWFGALQEELVRGWIGELPLLEITDEHGVKTPAIDHLEHTLRSARVVKEAAWTIDEHSSAVMKMWNREQDCLIALKRADGWDLLLWQQRQGIVALYREWLDQAKAGSRSARRLLARYRSVAAIPADEREHGEQLLDGGH